MRFRCSCDVGIHKELWLWVALSQTPNYDGFRCVADEDVPDLKRAGSRIDRRAITRPSAVPQRDAYISCAVSDR